MLRRVSDLKGASIGAVDGDIGSVHDLYFDAQSWTVRYLVVDTGSWLSGRRVLVSPRAVRGVDPDARRIQVELTREQVERSPDWDTDKPVSRQHEIEHALHYGYPYWWAGPYRWGAAYFPYPYVGVEGGVPPHRPGPVEEELLARERAGADSNLHSAQQVTGYYIQASDDDVGHVEDFLVDDRSWAIRYLIVDTRNWLPGKHVVVSPQWISDVNWHESTVTVDLSRDRIESSPAYDPAVPLEPAAERRLHDHYGRPWDEAA